MLSLPFPLWCVNKVSWGEKNFVVREGGTWTWKVYLDDGQFEKLDKVVADCENANDNNEPTACHLKHELILMTVKALAK